MSVAQTSIEISLATIDHLKGRIITTSLLHSCISMELISIRCYVDDLAELCPEMAIIACPRLRQALREWHVCPHDNEAKDWFEFEWRCAKQYLE